jgi:hypothetical protein
LANRKKDRRARSRKRRPSVASDGVTSVAQTPSVSKAAAGGLSTKEKRKSQRDRAPKRQNAHEARSSSASSKTAKDSRPQALWHPLPLSEILILAGAIGVVIGLRRGIHHGGGGPPLFAGIAAAALGTIEVMWREHWAGFRAHTVFLSLLPIVAFHTIVVLGISAFGHVSRALTGVLLVIDVALFVLLFRLMRARFTDARRERVFRMGLR